ncbi:MAG: hypothetical protein U0996_07075 [Planctomycetaceae bacterium]
MAESTQCSRCQKSLMKEWSVCPYCGQSRTQLPVSSVLIPTPATNTFSNPDPVADLYDAQFVDPNLAPAPEVTRRDTSLAGVGLIAVGATGSVVLIRTLSSMRLSIDSVMQIAGLLIMIMIVGVVLASRGKSTFAAILSGIVGGLITVLMAALIGILIVVSFVLYLIHDCLRILGQH